MSIKKKLKTAALFVALMGGVTAFAQTPQPVQQQENAQTEVNDSELQEFATVFKQVMLKNREAQQELVKVIQKEGLTVERYQELRKAEMDPEATVELKDGEKDKKANVDAQFKKMGPKLQKEQEDIIENSNLSLQRYKEIAMTLRSNKDLQMKFQKMLMAQDSTK